MQTKDRILDAAIGLFNAESVGAVSTNHIAAAAGISPGNLYYHFRNKEEIVRAIYQRMGAAWDVIFSLPAEREPTLVDLEAMIRDNFAVLWEYRFFYRELLALMQRDPALHALYLGRRRQGLADLVALLSHFGKAGVLDLPDDETAVHELADICWLLADFWLPYIELDGEQLSPATLQRGVELLRRALRPYLRSTHAAD